MSSFTQPTIALQTTMTLIMLGLIFAVLVDPYMDSRRSRHGSSAYHAGKIEQYPSDQMP
ncbi:MAG: hypothetical protein IKN28_02180 [Firmicutes bacterium]|nr:hypothetical protein [Bacillota bacterium]